MSLSQGFIMLGRFTPVRGLALAAMALLLPTAAAAQAKPYSLDQIATLLRGGLSHDYILGEIRPNCVSFRVDDAALSVLRESGGDDPFLGALRKVCYRPPGAAPGLDPAASVPLVYRPGQAALLSVLPGAGQFYTHRPMLGAAFLAAAAGAVVVGLQKKDLTVECLAHNAGAACPAAQQGKELSQKRPYLVPSLAAAAAVGIVSGIVALNTAVNVNRQAARAGEKHGALDLLPPSLTPTADGARVALIRFSF